MIGQDNNSQSDISNNFHSDIFGIDYNEDGIIDSNDRTILGYGHPDGFGGISNSYLVCPSCNCPLITSGSFITGVPSSISFS